VPLANLWWVTQNQPIPQYTWTHLEQSHQHCRQSMPLLSINDDDDDGDDDDGDEEK
jgi:hypothetical protein